METRQELILKFMLALASSSKVMKLFEQNDSSLVASRVYLSAAKLADEYIDMNSM